ALGSSELNERPAVAERFAQRPARKAYSTESKRFVKRFLLRPASDARRLQKRAKRASVHLSMPCRRLRSSGEHFTDFSLLVKQ
ncbi:hypothetical protein LCL99_18395, partial [Halomonas denitrificans]|uniref:hypothetical protein n=1 Tax=Halomonas denitrificans TaxID=370769 RepID=UPI001CD2ADF6